MTQDTVTTELLVKIKQLAQARDETDDLLRKGIDEFELLLKELKLGIPLSTKVPFEGHLIYKKEGQRWRLFFDNTEFNHAEMCVPLINCARAIRMAAIGCFPELVLGAVRVLEDAREQQDLALEKLHEAKKLLGALITHDKSTE